MGKDHLEQTTISWELLTVRNMATEDALSHSPTLSLDVSDRRNNEDNNKTSYKGYKEVYL